MKNLMKLLFICIFSSAFSAANAQAPAKDTVKSKTEPTQTTPTKDKDYVIMKKGAMVAVKNGEEANLLTTYQCTNGDKVSATGVVTMTDGTTRTLKEGDKVYRDGRLEAAKVKPEKSK